MRMPPCLRLSRPAALLAMLLVLCWPALAQLTLTVTSVPASTPPGDPVYIAGSFNSWNPGAPAFQLTPQGNGQYSITLPATVRGPIEFKFTRGSWAKVETQSGGGNLPNRTYTVPQTGTANWSGSIAGWADVFTWPGPGSTARPTVSIMHQAFPMPQLGRTRRIWLYVPPDYATSAKTYPVLYMHDGQNLFDVTTGFGGQEWGVDEALDNLHAQGDWGCIVVGIENGPNRLDEYSPYTNPQYGGGQGDAYVDFITNTLKPYVDSAYRTRPDRLNTGIMGSSMGGLISLYAHLKRPDIFGRAGVFSPSLWFNRRIYSYAKAAQPLRPDPRMYLVSGTAESQTQVRDQRQMVDTLAVAGFAIGTEVDSLIVRGGGHNETSWRQQFPAAYRYLFPSVTAVKPAETGPDYTLAPNPADSNTEYLVFKLTRAPKIQKSFSIQLVNAEGKVVRTATVLSGKARMDVRSLPAGSYRVQFPGGRAKGWVKR